MYLKFLGKDGEWGRIVRAPDFRFNYYAFASEEQYLAWATPLGIVEWPAGGYGFPQRIVVITGVGEYNLIAPAGSVYVMSDDGKTIDRL